MSAEEKHVYQLIVQGDPVPDVNKTHVLKLADLGFVTFSDNTGTPIALPPGEVAQRRIKEMLAEATERVARMAALPAAADQLADVYARAKAPTTAGSEYLDDPDVVNARLDDLINSASMEILAAQPGGPRTRAQLERSVNRDWASLARGITMRTLYRDSVRQSTAMADHIRMMTGHGAEYRTLVAPYERAIVIDRRHAFVSDYVVAGSPAHAAWHVTDPAALGFIVGAFMNAWQLAKPWQGTQRAAAGADGVETALAGGGECVDTVSAPDGGVRTTPLERAILRDMVDGIQQRTTATRLGISPRTLSKHVEVLKDKFGAVSPAQLGCKFALSPDYRVDDSKPLGDVTGAETAA